MSCPRTEKVRFLAYKARIWLLVLLPAIAVKGAVAVT